MTHFRSGGAAGADTVWATLACAHGYRMEIMTYPGHSSRVPQPKGSTLVEIPMEMLRESDEPLTKASRALCKSLPAVGSYARPLLARNWFIVKDVDAVFAIGKLITKSNGDFEVDGGTGWACKMFQQHKGEETVMYLFDMVREKWCQINKDGKWIECEKHPAFTGFKNVALIGSRELTARGKAAAFEVFWEC